jgi:S-adenosylmethionine-dependent methyltransferase
MATPDSLDDLKAYYQKNNESSRMQRQQLEYLVTLQLLTYYLGQAPRTVLELGAGAGAYTVPMAAAGHHVTANDLVDPLLNANREAVRAAGLEKRVKFHAGDARTVAKGLAPASFDVVLAMGPLYHLIRADEREALVRDLKSSIKAGGLLITAHMTRMGYVKYVFQNSPALITASPNDLIEIWENGFHAQHPRSGGFRGYWTTPGEAKTLHETCGLKWKAIHSQDAGIGSMDSLFNALPDPEKTGWARLAFMLSGDANTWGDARHFLCVGEVQP